MRGAGLVMPARLGGAGRLANDRALAGACPFAARPRCPNGRGMDLPALPATALTDRGVLAVAGPDAVSLLQGLVTANVERLGVGEVTHAALLTPQGKVLSAFFVWRTRDGLLLDVAPGDAEALLGRLRLYKLRADVRIEDRSGALTPQVGEEGPEDARPDPRLAGMGMRWLAEGDGPGGEPGAYEARRLSLGVPEFGRDHGPSEMFPMDVNLDALGAVDYRKGCFVGQEVASRMFRKGEVRKRSWTVTSERPLEVGAVVTAGASTLGTVTSAEGGAGIALLRLDRVAAAGEPPAANGVPVVLSPPAYLEGRGA